MNPLAKMKTLGSSLDHRSLNATVRLWSPQSTAQYAATTRKGEYYRGELPLNNITGAVWMTITNLAVLNDGSNPDILTNTTGNVFVSKTVLVQRDTSRKKEARNDLRGRAATPE